MLDSIDITDLSKMQTGLFSWLQDYILTGSFATQAVIIGAALMAGIMARRLAQPYLAAQIDSLKINQRTKNMFHSFSRLVMQLTALVILWIAAQLAGAEIFGALDMGLAQAVAGLLLAWIIIKIVVRFIPHAAVRNMFALIVWAVAALAILGILDQTVATLDMIGVSIGAFRLSALTVTKGAIALFILLYVALFVSGLLEQRVQRAAGLSISARVLLGKVIRVTLVTFALLIGVTAAGVDLSLFAIFSGAVGLGIGFGLQKGISNLFSGMMLLMDKSIKPGDVIELPDGAFGWVEHMGARYTEIITRDNKSYLVPNEDFITQRIINWSHGDSLIRIEVKFGVSYNANPHAVKALAEQVAAQPERVVADPAPVCHLIGFGDSSLDFALRFWIKDAHKGVTNMRGAVMLGLWDAFKEHNIAIPYPHRDIYIRGDIRDETNEKKRAT